MGDCVAFIFYDHGIRETIDSFGQNQQVRFDLTYKSPNDKGLPTDEEFEPVKRVEDQIEQFAANESGIYVGRVTTEGHRYFYCYTSATTERIADFIGEVERSTNYRLDMLIRDDPEKQGYWKDLFPTDDDWQMIQDSKTVEALKNHGDIGEIERRIDHWACFKSKADAQAYIAWLESEGFSLQELRREKLLSGDWNIQFFRSDPPALYTINRITYKLRHKAIELAGEYDGWETSVEKGDG